MPPGPSTEPTTEDCLYCPRCAKQMAVDRPHRGFAIAYRAWMGVAAVCVMFTPIFIADMITMLPLMGCAALGGSTLARLSNEPTRCKWCQLALEGPPRGFLGRRERLDEYRPDALKRRFDVRVDDRRRSRRRGRGRIRCRGRGRGR